MGSPGMRYSLVSREVIADSIETVVGAEGFDGFVALGGCDDAKVAALAQACSTTLDGLATTGGDAGCLVSGHAAGVAALLAARP